MTTTDRIKLLLEIGEADRSGDWPDYLQYGFVETDVPALLDLVADEAFDKVDSDSAEVWAPLHAWRTLGQLGTSGIVHGHGHAGRAGHYSADCMPERAPSQGICAGDGRRWPG